EESMKMVVKMKRTQDAKIVRLERSVLTLARYLNRLKGLGPHISVYDEDGHPQHSRFLSSLDVPSTPFPEPPASPYSESLSPYPNIPSPYRISPSPYSDSRHFQFPDTAS